jgi:hypothetical protein
VLNVSSDSPFYGRMIPSKVCIQSHMVLVYCICLF